MAFNHSLSLTQCSSCLFKVCLWSRDCSKRAINQSFGSDQWSWTILEGFADPHLAVRTDRLVGAEDRSRTDHPLLGRQTLYLMSYFRLYCIRRRLCSVVPALKGRCTNYYTSRTVNLVRFYWIFHVISANLVSALSFEVNINGYNDFTILIVKSSPTRVTQLPFIWDTLQGFTLPFPTMYSVWPTWYPMFSEMDLNHRPPPYQGVALTKLSYMRM